LNGVTVANNVEVRPKAEIELRAQTNDQLSISGGSSQTLRVAEGREQTAIFNSGQTTNSLPAKSHSSRDETVRKQSDAPRSASGQPGLTDRIHSGSSKTRRRRAHARIIRIPQTRRNRLRVAARPRGLDATSRLPVRLQRTNHQRRVLPIDAGRQSDFGLSRADINKQLEHTFGIWGVGKTIRAVSVLGPGNSDHISSSGLRDDFLSESRAAGFAPPPEMFASGLRNLQR